MSLHNYKIWSNYGGIEKENAIEMRHVNPQAAVEEAIEIYDRNSVEFFFAHNSTSSGIDVIIFCEDENGNITKWNLIVETVPQYYATEVK